LSRFDYAITQEGTLRKVQLIKVGRLAQSQSQEWGQIYLERLGKWLPTEFLTLKETEVEEKLQAMRDKGKRLVLLDEKGKALTTAQMARQIGDWREENRAQDTCFVVGGSYGFSESDRKLAHFLWKVSDLTLAGDIAWILAAEQIYRCFSIIHKTPYHHS
jgi:23S rRNA (pseudouridine1915-N3)-methyltransferase